MDINPIEGTESAGWKLEPLNPPQVITTHYTCAKSTQYAFPCIHKYIFQIKKSAIDHFSPEKTVPSCQIPISAKDDVVKELHYRMNIKGTKREDDFLVIKSPPFYTS